MKIDKCEFCEGEIKEQIKLVRFRYKGETIYVENVPVWVCTKCGENYYDAKVYKRLEEIARHRDNIDRVITFPLAKFDMPTAG